MTTNRILEFTPSQEEAIVARILVLLHQAVDEHFPGAEKATRQFTKTVFSDDSERTAIGAVPTTDLPGGFGSEEKTGPGERPPEAGAAPAPAGAAQRSGGSAKPGAAPAPPARPSVAPPSPQPASRANSSAPAAAASGAAGAASGTSGISGLSTLPKQGLRERRDWVALATLALLIAGLIFLAYTFLI